MVPSQDFSMKMNMFNKILDSGDESGQN
jgi:hypothetical protein